MASSRQAESILGLRTCATDPGIIASGYWDSLKKGLLKLAATLWSRLSVWNASFEPERPANTS
jgi:hypothetical protein